MWTAAEIQAAARPGGPAPARRARQSQAPTASARRPAACSAAEAIAAIGDAERVGVGPGAPEPRRLDHRQPRDPPGMGAGERRATGRARSASCSLAQRPDVRRVEELHVAGPGRAGADAVVQARPDPERRRHEPAEDPGVPDPPRGHRRRPSPSRDDRRPRIAARRDPAAARPSRQAAGTNSAHDGLARIAAPSAAPSPRPGFHDRGRSSPPSPARAPPGPRASRASAG